MEKTLSFYKRSIVNFEADAKNIAQKIIKCYPDRSLYVRTIYNRKFNSLNSILEERRNKKFIRDSMHDSAKDFALRLMNSNNTLVLVPEQKNKEEKPNIHHPIILNSGKNSISDDFKDLCAKGPSFIPTPVHFDWLNLQKDFDAFKNRLRARYIFSKNQQKNDPQTSVNVLPNPPKKPSNWKAPKTASPELETFISNIERSLFENTSKRPVTNNLTKGQRDSLKSWRKEQLFNTEGDLVLRTQDKGNRFVIVDKNTDKLKAHEQIERSSFVQLNHDPTDDHIRNVEEWAKKWHSNGEITKEWKDYIINLNAKPGKNSILYKTHKPGNPVRLVTSGCNTAIENLSRFIEVICAPLTENLPSRIMNTSHLLNIIDEINIKGIPDNTILVSFDVVNMFPSIDNTNGIKAVTTALESRIIKKPNY